MNEKNQEQETQKVVMAFGTFDILHAGHEYYLKKAKEMGDFLIVIVARDHTVTKVKGEKPLNSERKRLKNLRNANLADKVILGNHGDKHKVIEKYRPHVVALGYDQFVFTQTLEKTFIDLKLNTIIQRVESHHPRVYKSSLLKSVETTAKSPKVSIQPAST